MKRLLSLWLYCTLFSSIAQDYSVTTIPTELKEDANAVIRLDEGYFRIISIDKAEFSVKYAVTILNDQANDLARIFMGYDKLSSLTDIAINVFDSKGNRTRKVKSNEMYDRSAYTGNLFDDSRIKYIDVSENSFPYTVEVQYKLKYKFLYSIPGWSFTGDENISVNLSKFTLEYPTSVGARYKEYNFDGVKTESEKEGTKSITWRMEQLPAFEVEKYGPSNKEFIPFLEFGVSKFSFEGYEGDMSTWNGIAQWQRKLNEGRNNLSLEQLSEIKKITTGLSREEKIKAVYEYMQEKTRYVSIQLGVGGFQPFAANVVEENGYGDCKALSFYTKCLLEAVGIKAYYSWVYGGQDPPKVDRNFPKDDFNHIILAVPNANDTIWLECTSQTNPFGYLGSFTGDREALLINEEGGHIVRTTSYPTDGNVMAMNVKVKVNQEGHAIVNSQASYEGIKAGNMLQLSSKSYDDQKEYLEDNLDIPTFEITKFNIERDGQSVQRSLNLWVNKLMSKSGNRLFLQPNVMNKNYFVPLKYKERKTDIIVNYGYHEYDTVNFEFPPGYRIEATFDPVKIQSEFGEYESSIIAEEDGRFRYIRHFMQRKGRFEAIKYEEYLDFHKKVVRADKRKIALISGT